MRTRVLGLMAGIVLALSVGLAAAQPEEYPGASFCRDAPAWPDGTYLGQMHPYHADFYTRYAENRGWDPCTTWADDQRASAIAGLRTLGYTVYAPGEAPPAPGVTLPLEDPDPTWINLDRAVQLLRHAAAVGQQHGYAGHWARLAHPRVANLRFAVFDLGGPWASYVLVTNTVLISPEALAARPEALAAILAHEAAHAGQGADYTGLGEACLQAEFEAFQLERSVWSILRPADAPRDAVERGLNWIMDHHHTPAFTAWVRDTYRDFCAPR